jgi:hypothetical protein
MSKHTPGSWKFEKGKYLESSKTGRTVTIYESPEEAGRTKTERARFKKYIAQFRRNK